MTLGNLLGAKDIKIKVGAIADLEEIKRYRSRARLRVDANNCFGREAMTAMATTHDIAIEEPFDRGNWEAMSELQQRGVTVIADDSLCTFEDAEKCVASQSAKIWNLRLGKNGGITGVRALYELASNKNVSCGLGALVGESRALAAPGQALASCFAFEYVEQGFARWLVKGDAVRSAQFDEPIAIN